jgi:hypothetical protein
VLQVERVPFQVSIRPKIQQYQLALPLRLSDYGFAASEGVGVSVRTGVFAAMAAGLALSACAGRDPQPVASVQQQDVYSDCTMIRAEIEANNAKAKQLADEQGLKVAQNVAAGVVGIVVWPVLFAMDSKGAASTDAAALQARQQYLTTLAEQRCAPGYRPPLPPGQYPPYQPPPAPAKRTSSAQ